MSLDTAASDCQSQTAIEFVVALGFWCVQDCELKGLDGSGFIPTSISVA